ncbi:oxidoreductase [Aliikangiella coralliicola]|uniref:oxidoreductase n=1 Tax=Aliikangiella coralliicola TaxID=2592383 RepID=UPI001AEF87A2|nr:oxidoreductase [Aliikangiella coralliicola]
MDNDKKVAIVTGANGGVGYEVTKGLLKSGFHVVMACRSLEKANKAKIQILTDFPSSKLEVMTVDLSDFESVKIFAQEFQSKFQRLDILVNNAGILLNKPKKNRANIEMQFATNHLGHFLLTSLLLPLMPDSKSSRVVSLSSLAHKKSEIFFDDINCESQTKWDVPYAQSKLACLIFADELQRKLKLAGKKIISVSAHPGGTDSGLFEHMSPILMGIMRYTFVPIFLHSTENAAKPILKAALDSEAEGADYFGPTGLFEMKGKPGFAKRTKYSQREDVAGRLWSLSEELTGATFKVDAL